MKIALNRYGFYCLFRYGSLESEQSASGFVIKPWSRCLFSERNGGWRGFRVGPLYFRTYQRRPLWCK